MCHSNKISQSGRFIMDLLQFSGKIIGKLVKSIFLFGSIILLTACATTVANQQDEVGIHADKIQVKEQVEESEEVETLPLSSELVYYVLMAEVAGQRGEISVATELYNKAAETIESPALASRSAQVANYTRDKKRINRALSRWLEVDPDNAEVYIMQLPFLIIEGEFDEMVKSANKALALRPESSRQVLAQIADGLGELAQREPALDALQKLDLYQQADPEALFVYARLAAFYKQYESALSAINNVLTQQVDREDALILKAEVLQRLGLGNKALAVLKGSASPKTASDNLRFAYAKSLGENNKSEQAQIIFEQLHTKLPKNEEILFALGLLALEKKEGVVAKRYFSQLISMGDPGKQAAYFMGLSEEIEENTESALIWFASVPANSSRFQASQARYVRLLAANNQLKKARLHLKLLRKENPEQALQYYIFEGVFLREQGEKQAAFDLYTEALAFQPKGSELLYGRAMVAESLNRLAVFEDDMRQLLVMDPNNDTVLNALGYTLTDRTNRHEEALSLIQRAIEISPEDPFYLDSLGWVYYRMGNLTLAVKYLKQAVEIKPDTEFRAHLGEVLWVQGKKVEAKHIWQQAIESDSENKLLKDTLRRFGE